MSHNNSSSSSSRRSNSYDIISSSDISSSQNDAAPMLPQEEEEKSHHNNPTPLSKFHHLKNYRVLLGMACLLLIALIISIIVFVVNTQRAKQAPKKDIVDDDSSIDASSSHSWVQIGPDIHMDGSTTKSEFGSSISMSGDGARLAIGAPSVWVEEEEKKKKNSGDEDRSLLLSSVVNVYEIRGSSNNKEWVSMGSDVVGNLDEVDTNDDASTTFPTADLGRQIVVLSKDGDTLAIGSAFYNSGGKRDVGRVQIFRFNAEDRSWFPLGAPIVGEKEYEYAGASIALSSNGDVVAIGSPGSDSNGKDSGLVNVFQYNASSGWIKLGPDIQGWIAGDRFGWSVSLSSNGRIVAVGGAAAQKSDISEKKTVARILEYKAGGSGWNEVGAGIQGRSRIQNIGYAISSSLEEWNDLDLSIEDAIEKQNMLGWSVLLSADGSTVVASNKFLTQDKEDSIRNHNALFVEAFKYESGNWTSLGDIKSGSASEGQTAFTVSISEQGDVICVGETGYTGNTKGRVHIYAYNGTGWTQTGPTITSEDPSNTFGSAVSLSADGSRFAVGEPLHNEDGNQLGRVKVFQNPFLPTNSNKNRPSAVQPSRPDNIFSNKIPPNVIFIMSDDLGYGDLASYGHPYANTPHLDQLAAEGTLFQRSYATGSVCNPSRTGFMTSRHPYTFPNYAGDFGFLGATTITELLSSTHKIGHVGKWHIGPDATVGTYDIGSIKTNGGDPDSPRGKDGVVFDNAIEFIEENKDKPFYLNVWGRATHKPVRPSEILVNNSGLADLVIDRDKFGKHMQEKFDIASEGGSDLSKHMANYLADVFGVDVLVGELLKKIDDLGLRNKTIIVYTSDQGAAPVGNNRDDLRNMLGYAGGLRGGKHTIFDGGVRIPFIVRWPGKVPAGKVNRNSVFSGLDWLPTLCAICGIPINQTMFEGEDVSDIWLGSDRSRTNPLFWGRGKWIAVLYGNWKLHRLLDQEKIIELYDIDANPEEDKNIAGKHQNIVNSLLKSAEQYSEVTQIQRRKGSDPKPFDPSEPPIILKPQ